MSINSLTGLLTDPLLFNVILTRDLASGPALVVEWYKVWREGGPPGFGGFLGDFQFLPWPLGEEHQKKKVATPHTGLTSGKHPVKKLSQGP